jgi:hypothetical protein
MADPGRRNRDALAVAQAGGATLRAGAKAARMSEWTATRRWADPAFRRRVTELRAAAVERATGRLANGMARAADVLRRLLRRCNNGSAGEPARTTAHTPSANSDVLDRQAGPAPALAGCP